METSQLALERMRKNDLPFPGDVAGLLFGLLIFSVVIFARNKQFLSDPDMYWHIATGKWIWANQAFPRHDIFSHSIPGKAWVDLEWLSQIILFAIYQLTGWRGLILLCGTVVSVTFVLLYALLARDLRATVAMGAAATAIVFASDHFLARPHLLTFPIIVIWTAVLARASEERRRPTLWLLPLMTLWANLHGGFTLGLFLVVGFGVEATLAAAPPERRRVAKEWLGFSVGSLVAGCITPYGYDYVLQTYYTLDLGEVLLHIGEMRPMSPYTEYRQEIILLGLLAMALIFGVRIGFARVLMIVVLLHFALQHVRGLAILALVLPLMIAHPLQQQFALLKPIPDPLPLYDIRRVRPIATLIALTSTLIMATLVGTLSVIWHKGEAPAADITPAAAIDHALTAGASGPVLNDYDFGGYLIFRGIPTFIDGRTLLFGKEFALKYADADAPSGGSKLDELTDAYGITWTLLRPQSAAASHFDHASGWRRVYADEAAVVHLRRSPSGAGE